MEQSWGLITPTLTAGISRKWCLPLKEDIADVVSVIWPETAVMSKASA